ncbi:MAG: hypothetical protein HGA52_00830 [Bacteroidales bacterium]|nr:hypothetical protein [Bacteroidales bacterium]
MLKTIPTDNDTRIRTLGEAVAYFFLRLVEVERVDVVTMRHDRTDTLLIKPQNVGNDGLFSIYL